MTHYIDETLGAGGYFARQFAGFIPRSEQIRYAHAVEATIAKLGQTTAPVPPLFIEGPTGVGKSLAYLTPASFWSASENPARVGAKRRTLVVTANIALQEQLVLKDLPTLAKSVPWKFSFAIAKGISNYLCVNKTAEQEVQAVFAGLDAVAAVPRQQQLNFGGGRSVIDERSLVKRNREIEEWMRTTETGDFSELSFELDGQLRAMLSSTSEECPGSKCPSADICFARAARRRFAEADIIVTNYHMFFIDLMAEGQILPPYDVLICDEAHAAADIARDFFGWHFSRGTVTHFTRQLGGNAKLDPGLAMEISQACDTAFGTLLDIGPGRVREPNAIFTNLPSLLERASIALERGADSPERDIVARTRLRAAAKGCGLLAQRMTEFMSLAGAPKTIYFAEIMRGANGQGRARIIAKPITVGEKIDAFVFQQPGLASVWTSATMSTIPDDYDHVTRELGAFEAKTLAVKSPFDYANRAALLVLENIPEAAGRDAAVCEAFVDSVMTAKGRTLGLFTSMRAMKLASDALKASGFRGRVLTQGEAPRSKLVAEFKADEESVLVGVESFWTGVDVPGPACSLVFIDKLPFPTPDDPILQAYDEVFGQSSFQTYSMPRALLRVRQGVGRLIRSITDRGVVVIADSRLLRKGYGKQFMRSMPPMRVVKRLADAQELLEAVAS